MDKILRILFPFASEGLNDSQKVKQLRISGIRVLIQVALQNDANNSFDFNQSSKKPTLLLASFYENC